jgi:hypothetical protein
MLRGLSLTRPIGRSLALASALACLVSAPAGAAVTASSGQGPLSPLLGELARPAVASKSPAAQANLLDVPLTGPASLVREGNRVLVTARFAGGAGAALAALGEAGAAVVSIDPDQQTTTLSVAPADLAAIAAAPGVRSVWQVRQPLLYGAGEASCEGGSVISEGLGQLRVDEARNAFGLRGRGVTVGVLSDSYDVATEAASGGGPPATHAAQDVASNDLPGPGSSCSDQQLPVAVLDEGSSQGADEGRAMLQIVHDLAPHAKLAFATAFESEESFAQNIERLARPVAEGGAGADVIVDDVAWFEEPFFQDGPVAEAIDKVTAAGVTYLTATGNDNLLDGGGHEIASWEAPSFRDSGACPEAVAGVLDLNGKHCMDFDPGAEVDRSFGITVEPGRRLIVDLQWGEPWRGVQTDLDAFLFSGKEMLGESIEDNASVLGTQRPVEVIDWTNGSKSSRTVQLAVNRFSGASPRLKFILMENGSGVSATEYPSSLGSDVVGPTVFGHAGAAAAIAAAAVPYGDSEKVERYSSRGPVTHLFGPVVGAAPAAAFGSPQVIAKPDLAATDCGATTFFAFLSAGTWRFCGTSAAAPHAAAVAALLRQAKPSLSVEELREALTDTASPVGAFPATAVGGGLVDAFAALDSLPEPLEGEDEPSSGVPPLVESPVSSAAPAPGSTTAGGATGGGSPGAAATPAARFPVTRILKHPRKLVRIRTRWVALAFRFGSNEAGSTFLCKIDRAPYRRCGARFLRRYAIGRHVLRVKARSAAGLTDPTPATFRFRVARG